MMKTPKHRFRLKTLAALLALAAAPLAANAWTNKPVKMIVPAPPGGTMDIVARILAESISSEIGQPVIVENKPGAGGAIAVQALNAAPPDGQTIMVTASVTTSTVTVTIAALTIRVSHNRSDDTRAGTLKKRGATRMRKTVTRPANTTATTAGPHSWTAPASASPRLPDSASHTHTWNSAHASDRANMASSAWSRALR